MLGKLNPQVLWRGKLFWVRLIYSPTLQFTTVTSKLVIGPTQATSLPRVSLPVATNRFPVDRYHSQARWYVANCTGEIPQPEMDRTRIVQTNYCCHLTNIAFFISLPAYISASSLQLVFVGKPRSLWNFPVRPLHLSITHTIYISPLWFKSLI